MTFIGGDAMDGLDADFDGDLSHADAPFQLFSLRNLINFLLGFSWTGIAFFDIITNKILLIVIAILVGVGFVGIFFLIIKQLMKLAEENSFKMEETLGKTAEVYLTIPANKTGKGKILVSVKGSVRELDAMSENVEKITSGNVVRIVKIENNNVLIVEKI